MFASQIKSSIASSKVVQQSIGKDPVVVGASYISRDNSNSAINISTQRKSGSVVGLIPSASFGNQTQQSQYGYVQAKVKTRLAMATSMTKTYLEKRASVLEQKTRSTAKKQNEHKQPLVYKVDLTTNEEVPLPAQAQASLFDSQLQSLQRHVIKNDVGPQKTGAASKSNKSQSPTKWSPSKRALYSSKSDNDFLITGRFEKSEDTHRKQFLPEKRLFGGNGGASKIEVGADRLDESMSLALKSELIDSKKKDEISKYLSPMKLGLHRQL